MANLTEEEKLGEGPADWYEEDTTCPQCGCELCYEPEMEECGRVVYSDYYYCENCDFVS